MRKRDLPVAAPAYPGAARGPCRVWTELTLGYDELMELLGMPKGTRLISIGSDAITGVRITVEEPPEV